MSSGVTDPEASTSAEVGRENPDDYCFLRSVELFLDGAPFDQLNERATFADAPVDFYRFHYLNGFFAQSESCSINKMMFMNG